MNPCETTRAALEALFPQPFAAPPAAEGEEGQPAPPRQPGVAVTDPARTGHHLDVLCRPDQVQEVARVMDGQAFFLEAVSGVDWLDRGEMEVLYDYCRLGGEHCRVLVRVVVDRAQPEVETVSGIFPAADWHERETYDFYGIRFSGHPNLIRILLPEDADFYPLRKDYQP